MKISIDWLRRYVDVKGTPEKLAEELTMQGLEVEGIERSGRIYDGFVVGEVKETARHPNADKLSVCIVDVGGELKQIVCGAPNVAAGQKVAVGLAGAVVPHNQHDPGGAPFTLTRATIRGVESHGMICSAFELNLGNDRDGILVLDSKARSGTRLAEYLGKTDIVMEIGLTPNRSDAMSHIGIAREIAALRSKKIKTPAIRLKETREKSAGTLKVLVQAGDLCPRYSARVARKVLVAPSPRWLQESLSNVGVRPVNNIVDITNFVMLECGQPLHAFDAATLEGGKVIVRRSAEGEKFTTLDHISRNLRKDTLLICDAARPIGIAGVMGGLNSEITPSTTSVVIEGAYFNPQSIRRSSKNLGLSTDASQRFERGTDYDRTVWAVNRAAQLMQEVTGCEILRGVIDIYPRKIKSKVVKVKTATVNKILGITIDGGEITSGLARLGIVQVSKGKAKSDERSFRVPTFRTDLDREIDLIEEVARIHGYDNIQPLMEARVKYGETAPERDFVGEIREALIGCAYQEIVTNSMQEKGIATLGSDDPVLIANPISVEMAAMRTSLIPSMLRIVRNNIFQGTRNLRLFEIGKTYHASLDGSGNRTYGERRRVLLGITGLRSTPVWNSQAGASGSPGLPSMVDIFDLKGDLRALSEKIFLDKCNFIPYRTTKALTGKGLVVEINGVESGYLGMISKELLKKFEIEQDVIAAEVDFDALLSGLKQGKKFQPLSRFPSVLRDLALVVDEKVTVGEAESVIREHGQPYLSNIRLFDVYAGDQVPAGRKSVAFALEFLSAEQTMTQEEINGIMKKILAAAKRVLNAELRAI